MDKVPPPRDVDPDILKVIRIAWSRLQAEWNALYSKNPVEDDDE
jgi:hypothetical protein